MAERGIPTKQIVVTIPTFERFESFNKYDSRHEGLLVYIMDLADKELARTNQPRNNGKFIKENNDGKKS